jgi:hypothetical protein
VYKFAPESCKALAHAADVTLTRRKRTTKVLVGSLSFAAGKPDGAVFVVRLPTVEGAGPAMQGPEA